IQVDPIVVDGDQRSAFDGLVTSEVRKCHASNLGGDRKRGAAGRWGHSPAPRGPHPLAGDGSPRQPSVGNTTAAATVVLDG
ncbi:MAG TPA: hypothetical protein VIO95_08080, partial [Mycobacterium sp.]